MSAILQLIVAIVGKLIGGIGWLGQVTYGIARGFGEVVVEEIKKPRKVQPYGPHEDKRRRFTRDVRAQLRDSRVPGGEAGASDGAGTTARPDQG